MTRTPACVISGFSREIVENCALLGYYSASSGKFVSTFWDNVSFPSSTVKNPKRPLKMGPTGFPETWVRNCHCSLRDNPEERSSQNISLIKFPFLYPITEGRN
jgi:hypothetical protein